VLRPDGAPRGEIGRRGNGPGEFTGVWSVEVVPGDTVLVWDVQPSRLTLFEPASWKPVRTVSVAMAGGGHPSAVASLGNRGFVASYTQGFSPDKPERSDHDRWLVIGSLDPSGVRQRDSVLVLPGDVHLVVRRTNSMSVGQNPFGRGAILRVSSDRLYYARTDSAIVRSYALDGAPGTVYSVAFTPVPLTRSVVDSAAENGMEMFREAMRREAPAYWPVMRDFVVGDSGDVWIGLASTPQRVVTYVVLNDQGRELRRFDWPWNLTLRAVRGELLYVTAMDENDVPRVLVLRRRG